MQLREKPGKKIGTYFIYVEHNKKSNNMSLISKAIQNPIYNATPKVTKYQRSNFIIQIHKFTIKIDTISINLLFECVKIVESVISIPTCFLSCIKRYFLQIKMYVF